jgi:hypothetical protein
MGKFELVAKFFHEWSSTSDEMTYQQFQRAINSPDFSPATQQQIKTLSQEQWHYLHGLPGENGSAQLLQAVDHPDRQAVVKTYDPVADFIADTLVEKNRIAEIRQELASFLVAEQLELVRVPPTTVVLVTDAVLDSWHMPHVIDSHQPKQRVVMLQQFIESSQTFATLNQDLPDIASSNDVFGLLAFDYLIAYGDGRGRNLLVDSDKRLWAIDHGGSFRLDGSIRNTEQLGIPEDYVLPDTQQLQAALSENNFKALEPTMKGLLTHQQTVRFGVRFHKLQHFVRSVDQCTLRELKTAMK